MKRIATFDLDSTLCDTEHRFGLINRTGYTDWKKYALACENDVLVEGIERLVQTARLAGLEVHYVTGRHEESRKLTVEWLRINLGEGPDVGTRLHMDTSETDHVQTFGSHAAYKVHVILELAERLGAEVFYHVDDHASVISELAKNGIPGVAVRPPYEVRELATRDVAPSNESILSL